MPPIPSPGRRSRCALAVRKAPPGSWAASLCVRPPGTCCSSSVRSESAPLLLRLPLLKLLDVLLRFLLERIPAAAAANVVILTLVAHPDRAQTAAHHALRLAVPGGERLALLGGAHLVDLRKQRPVL